MRRISTIAVILATAAAFLMPQAQAQTWHRDRKSETHRTLTPEQRERNKAINARFTVCHNKAIAEKIMPKARRDYMKNCLAEK